MQLQILSDLHLETESYAPQPATGAELLVLAGDIDSTWEGMALFRDWPVPVIFVAGNHEFDGREMAGDFPAEMASELRTCRVPRQFLFLYPTRLGGASVQSRP